VVSDAVARQPDRTLGGWYVTKRVEQHEVMDRAIEADSGDVDPRFLQLARVSFAFVTKWIVLGGYNEGRRKPASSSLLARSGET